MKIIYLFIIQICFIQTSYSQIKTDTIYGISKDIYSIYDSKISEINKKIDVSKFPKLIKYDDVKNIENIPELETMFLLNSFNKFEKTSIFNEYEYFVISYYSNTNDLFTETRLFEFYFDSADKAKRCLDTLNKIVLKSQKEVNDLNMIGGNLNFYFVQKENRIYFIYSKMPDNKSPIKKNLELVIKDVLNL